MARERRNHLDDLLSKSDDILRSIGAAEDIAKADAPVDSSPAQEQARRKFQRTGYSEYLPFDGYAEISVSDDEMSVTGHFYPPGEGMKPIEPDTVNAQLHEKQVVLGVDWNAISEAIFRCNTEGVEILDVVIARGLEPKNAVTSHIVLEKRAGTKMEFDKDDSDRIDYRSGGCVTADVGILHSGVYAGDRVEVGSRGIIVGGEIHCQNGLSASQIGTETGARTEIYCGTDYQVERNASNVQFWLDRKSGRIQVGSLGRVKQETLPKRRSQIP